MKKSPSIVKCFSKIVQFFITNLTTQAADKHRINLSFYSTLDKCPEMYDFLNEIIDFGSQCLVGQLRQTVSDHKCKKVVETRRFDGNFGRGKEVEECIGFFKRWINSGR